MCSSFFVQSRDLTCSLGTKIAFNVSNKISHQLANEKNKMENYFHAKMCQAFSELISDNLKSSLSLNHVLKGAIMPV